MTTKVKTPKKAKKPIKADKPIAPSGPQVILEEDAPAAKVVSSAELSQISGMASRMLQIDKAVETLTDRIKSMMEEKERIQGADLPSLMEELGMKSFKLKTGEEVIIKPIIKGSLPTETQVEKEKDPDKRLELKTRYEEGMAYLIKNNAGALIKSMVYVELGKDAAKPLKEAMAALKKLGLDPKKERGVNANSLNAWIKERIEGGNPPDFTLFKIYSGNRAEVKTPKPAAKTLAAKA